MVKQEYTYTWISYVLEKSRVFLFPIFVCFNRFFTTFKFFSLILRDSSSSHFSWEILRERLACGRPKLNLLRVPYVWPVCSWKCALRIFLDRNTYFPPFRQGRWHTGIWQRFPFQAAGHMQTFGRTQSPPLIHGGLHRGYWHCSPIYSAGHLQTSRATHKPPFWQLGVQGAVQVKR